MASLTTSTTATDKIVDAVASQAAEIAKDVAVPAARIAAVHLLRTRAKGMIAVLLAATAIVFAVRRRKGAGSATDSEQA